MKRSFFQLCFILSCSTAIQAQEQIKRELNWSNFSASILKSTITTPVNTGDFVVFKINDINKFLFKVEIKGNSFNLETPIPTELEKLFALSPSDLEKTTKTQKTDEAKDKISDAVKDMKDVLKKINSNGVAVFTEEEKTTIKGDLAKVIKKCELYYTTAADLANDIFLLKKKRNELIVIAQMDATETQIKNKVLASTTIAVADVEKHYTAFKDSYYEVEKLYEKAILDAGADVETQKLIKAALEKIEEGYKSFNDEGLLGLLNEVNYFSTELLNPKNFMVESPPIQVDGDYIRFEVNITPTVTRTLGPNRSPVGFNFDVPAKRGIKVDFSVGPAFSVGKGARDDRFFLAEVQTKKDTVVLRQRDNNNAINPGVYAMMHVYRRTGKPFAWGGVFGVGAGFQSVQDANLGFLAGLSGILGKRQKVMVSLGLLCNKVDRLKEKQFVLDKEYNTSKIEIGNISEKVFKPSFFLAVSFSLANKVEVK
jgi:hypothetical protein